MTDTVTYKGHEIHAVPHRVADTGAWAIRVRISHDVAGETRARDFTAAGTCSNHEEAIHKSLELGRQIVDRKLPGVSIEDL